MILIFSIFSMKFSRNNINAAILKIIKISRNCRSRFTANYSKFLASRSIDREMWYNITPTFLKIWKFEPYVNTGYWNRGSRNPSVQMHWVPPKRVLPFEKSSKFYHESYLGVFLLISFVSHPSIFKDNKYLFSSLGGAQLPIEKPYSELYGGGRGCLVHEHTEKATGISEKLPCPRVRLLKMRPFPLGFFRQNFWHGLELCNKSIGECGNVIIQANSWDTWAISKHWNN